MPRGTGAGGANRQRPAAGRSGDRGAGNYLYGFSFEGGPREQTVYVEWRLDYLGAGLVAYRLRLEARTHEDRSDEELYRPIETLVGLINDSPVSRLAEVVAARLDLSAFMRYVAAQNFVAERDGFLGDWGVNNFYLYRLADSDTHVLIPWDADLSFERAAPPVDARHGTNVLMAKLMAVPEYAALYRVELRRAAAMAQRAGDRMPGSEASSSISGGPVASADCHATPPGTRKTMRRPSGCHEGELLRPSVVSIVGVHC